MVLVWPSFWIRSRSAPIGARSACGEGWREGHCGTAGTGRHGGQVVDIDPGIDASGRVATAHNRVL